MPCGSCFKKIGSGSRLLPTKKIGSESGAVLILTAQTPQHCCIIGNWNWKLKVFIPGDGFWSAGYSERRVQVRGQRRCDERGNGIFIIFTYLPVVLGHEAKSRDRNNDYYIPVIYNTQIMDGTIFEKQKKYGAHCIIVSGSCYKSKNLKWIKINSSIS